MKKTFAVFLTLLLLICIFSACTAQHRIEEEKASSNNTILHTEDKTATETPTEKSTQTLQKPTIQSTENSTVKTEKQTSKKAESNTVSKSDSEISRKNALFIGDSRTIGLMEYSGLSADFFANTGMSVYNIYDKKVSVPNAGKFLFNELLSKKKYNTIYLMLGINELGYDINKTVSEYKKLVSYIKKEQPEAVIFIQKNLHVTKVKSDSEKYINNGRLNTLNAKIAEIADGKTVFCLDANILFDDANGALDASKTSDHVHLYAKYYLEWGKWITKESKKILEEANS